MLGLRGLLYIALGGSGLLFSLYAVMLERARAGAPRATPAVTARPRAVEVSIGFATNFFDTLGIGSFAPTTSLFRLLRLVPDHLIPGTLMVGHMMPIIAQALIYIRIIAVDTTTLVLLIAASALGAFFGSGVVSRLPRRGIQLGMGGALLVAALVMLASLVGLVPAGGDRVALTGGRLLVGMAGNFLLGTLMSIGIGAYAPSLILFGLLGMNVKSIFPIMMGSCALLMPAGGVKFVKQSAYAPHVALALTLGGIPGVLVAAFVVRELPLLALRWMVLVVVVYTGVTMLRAGLKSDALTPDVPAPPPAP